MKSNFLVLLILICTAAKAQTDSIVRYWAGTVQTNLPQKALTRAVYYLKNGMWQVESRYLSTGNIFMTGTYKDSKADKKDGVFTWYYEDGKLRSTVNYIDDQKEGLMKTWHENGRLKDSVYYKSDFPIGKGRSWNERGEIVGIYELDGTGSGMGRFFYGMDSLHHEGTYTQGRKTGTWSYFAPKGFREWEVTYVKDSISMVKCYDSLGNALQDCVFEREAQPGGGLEGWRKYLSTMLDPYDNPSRKLMKSKVPLSGMVWVRFLVEKDGSLGDIQIMQSLNSEADEIVVNTMRKAPRWTPGMLKNKVVRSYHTQPITFNVE